MNVISIFIGFIFIMIITRIVYQRIKKKRLPPSNYTPFDDLISGIDPDLKQNNQIIKDTKHETAYEEITNRKD